MARKRKGRAVSGWLIVDKPAGITSTSVVNKVRWAFEAQKAGHAGTLDPDATGVLAVALGEATKTVPFITDALKCYRFMLRFGAATTTDDASGEVVAQSDLRPDDAAIAAALGAFRGEIMQVPPQYSAVKVDGERAYDLAREGEVMELAARPLWVESLEVMSRPDADHLELEMVCGKGGYVRSIARDLGAALGCLGHVAWLRRTWSGPFDVENGISMEKIEELARTCRNCPQRRKVLHGCAMATPEWSSPRTPDMAMRPGPRIRGKRWRLASIRPVSCTRAGCSTDKARNGAGRPAGGLTPLGRHCHGR